MNTLPWNFFSFTTLQEVEERNQEALPFVFHLTVYNLTTQWPCPCLALSATHSLYYASAHFKYQWS